MRVLVCGGRDYHNYNRVREILDFLHSHELNLVIIHGGATGADALADRWARERPCACVVYHAQWKQRGRAAGPIRNQQMIDEGKPDIVIAFPGGRGTADMVGRARVANIDVREVQ